MTRWVLMFVATSLTFVGVGAVAAGAAENLQDTERTGKPRLVLVLILDQARGEYLDRFAGEFSKGLGRLVREGVTFTDGHQNHAVTATGPGHATVSTGAFPSRSGIVGNQWYENDGKDRVYCVEDQKSPLLTSSGTRSDDGHSPQNLLVTALPDWMKAADPETRVFSASRKDRAAVLMGGNLADAAYWYDESTGEFASSTYYFDRLPDWVDEFNARRLPDTYFGEAWSELQPVADPQKLSIRPTDFGWFEREFPHAIGGPSSVPNSSFYSSFGGTPFMEQYLAEFVKTLIREERIGLNQHTDYLAVSFSALDSVGHSYGPNSREILDEFRRVDEAIGELFQLLDEQVGAGRYVTVLTADHGAMELPEYLQQSGEKARRIDDEAVLCIQNRGKDFMKQYGAEEDWFLSGYYLNYAAVGRANLLREQVERDAAELLEQCDFIRKVWTRTELEKPGPATDYFHGLFRNSYYPGRSPDLYVQTEENYLASTGTGTSHGTPYHYDTHVPMIFLVPGVTAQRVDGRVATADIAPTLAELIGIDRSLIPEIDGRSLVSRILSR